MNYFGDTVQDGASLKMKNLAKYICYGGLRSRYGFMFLVSPSIFSMCSNYAAYVIWRSMKPLLGERAEEEGEVSICVIDHLLMLCNGYNCYIHYEWIC